MERHKGLKGVLTWRIPSPDIKNSHSERNILMFFLMIFDIHLVATAPPYLILIINYFKI